MIFLCTLQSPNAAVACPSMRRSLAPPKIACKKPDTDSVFIRVPIRNPGLGSTTSPNSKHPSGTGAKLINLFLVVSVVHYCLESLAFKRFFMICLRVLLNSISEEIAFTVFFSCERDYLTFLPRDCFSLVLFERTLLKSDLVESNFAVIILVLILIHTSDFTSVMKTALLFFAVQEFLQVYPLKIKDVF